MEERRGSDWKKTEEVGKTAFPPHNFFWRTQGKEVAAIGESRGLHGDVSQMNKGRD